MTVISGISFPMEAQTMRPLNEILQTLREKHGYTEQRTDQLSRELKQFAELSYMAYMKQKRLSDKKYCDKSDI